MGIRSDVGIALKKDVVLSEETMSFLAQADVEYEDEEGTLYVFEYVKWYRDSYQDLINLYNDLKSQDEESYLICEACHDHPSYESDGNSGAWYDNPWGLSVCISVSLNY